MHPALLYTARDRSSTATDPGGERSDLMPRMLGVAAAGLAAAAVAQRRATRRTVLAGRGDEQVLTTRDGARLAYRRTGRVGDPGVPVVLLENALLATPEHWEWVADALGKHAEVVTYSRAGYGPSGDDGPESLDGLVEHGAELVAAVADGRPVVVVGHSLGGYLAMKVAARDPERVRAVVLVDSSHPEELDRSDRQKAGSESLSRTFSMIYHSLRLGCGPLLEVPDWVLTLPEAARRTALAQYRDARLWYAGRREWTATLEAFTSGASVPRLGVPVLGLSAERTIAQEKVQRELHEELVEAGDSRSRGEIVPSSNHDTILTARGPARSAAAQIVTFLTELELIRTTAPEVVA
jgi:pimeloyl-ACP methyl ester carboxylesterase